MNWGPAEYVEAYEGGASIDEIAMIAGKSYSTVYYHLKKRGVQFRPRAHPKSNAHEGEGHQLNDYGQCMTCKTKAAREKYQNDPEYRDRKLAASRNWKQRKKEQDEHS